MFAVRECFLVRVYEGIVAGKPFYRRAFTVVFGGSGKYVTSREDAAAVAREVLGPSTRFLLSRRLAFRTNPSEHLARETIKGRATVRSR